jgi:hypothetical protein
MKRLLLVVLVLGAAFIGASYYATGRLPWVAQSPEEAQVAELREAFSAIRQQWKQAGRAGTFGMDTSTVTDSPLAKLEALEASMSSLAPRLNTPEARNQMTVLRREVAAFKSDMR